MTQATNTGGRTRVSLSIRFRPHDLEAIQEHHRNTRDRHQLSFNQWVVQTLLDRLDQEAQK